MSGVPSVVGGGPRRIVSYRAAGGLAAVACGFDVLRSSFLYFHISRDGGGSRSLRNLRDCGGRGGGHTHIREPVINMSVERAYLLGRCALNGRCSQQKEGYKNF